MLPILEELDGLRVEVEIDSVGILELDSEAITDDDKSPDVEADETECDDGATEEGLGRLVEETGVVATVRRVDREPDEGVDASEILELVRIDEEVPDGTAVVTAVVEVDAATAAATFVVILLIRALTHVQKPLEIAAGLYPICPPPGILMMAAPARSGEASTHSTTKSVVVLIVSMPQA